MVLVQTDHTQLIQIYAPTFYPDQYLWRPYPPLSFENIYLYSFLFSGNVCLCVVVMLKQLTRPSYSQSLLFHVSRLIYKHSTESLEHMHGKTYS